VKQLDESVKNYYDIRTHNNDSDQAQHWNVDFWKGVAHIMGVSEKNGLTSV
jgi:hypothetical protein